MCKCWYNYGKTKYGDNTNLCYTDTTSFIVPVKLEYFCLALAKNVAIRLDTSNV